MKKTIEITNGPSREELFDGLRLSSEKRLVPFLTIKNEMEKYMAVIIHSIEAEDGSGQSWNLAFSVNSEYLSDEFFIEKVKKEEHVVAHKVDFNYFRQLVEEGYRTAFSTNGIPFKKTGASSHVRSIDKNTFGSTIKT